MRSFAVWVIIFVVLMGSGQVEAAGSAQEKSYSADRFDVAVTIQEDGSLLITETVDYRFIGGPFTFVFREIDTAFTDGVEIRSAAVDGRVYPEGENAGQVELSGGDTRRVEWHFEPTSNIVRTFTLTYVMNGVVRRENDFDLVRYQPLPENFDFPIESATVTISYPPEASLTQEPSITAGLGTITRSEGQITVTAQNIAPNETLVLDIPFASGSLIEEPPQWQLRQAQGRALLPLWLTSGLAVVFGSLLGVITLWRRNRPQFDTRLWAMDTPPTDHSPGVAGLLASGGLTVTWSHALSTMFDLARRGYVHIEEIPKKGWFSRTDFWVTREKVDVSDLTIHEIAFLSLIFTDKKKGNVDRIKMSQMSKVITSSRWNGFKEVLKNQIKSGGYISSQRIRARRLLFIIGGILMALGGVTLFLAVLFSDQLQEWPLFLVGGWLLAGMIFIIAGALQSPLTNEGARIAAEWKQFFETLKSITKGKLTVDQTQFENYLSFAAAAGLLAPWVKWFQKQEAVPLPPYFTFHSADPADGFTAFVALAAMSSSSGGSAAGGTAGGGAAGGGSAGAG